jgi:hypothetical protein
LNEFSKISGLKVNLNKSMEFSDPSIIIWVSSAYWDSLDSAFLYLKPLTSSERLIAMSSISAVIIKR